MERSRLVSPGSFCWNPGCPDYGKIDHGNIIKFGRTKKGTQRYRCKTWQDLCRNQRHCVLWSPSSPRDHSGVPGLVGRAQQSGRHSPNQGRQPSTLNRLKPCYWPITSSPVPNWMPCGHMPVIREEGGIRRKMVETWGQVPGYGGWGRPKRKQAQPDWHYLQVVKHRSGNRLGGHGQSSLRRPGRGAGPVE